MKASCLLKDSSSQPALQNHRYSIESCFLYDLYSCATTLIMIRYLLLFCCFCLSLNSQSLQLSWFTQNDQFNIIDSKMDPWGDIVVAGTFSGIVDFDHGPHLRVDTAEGPYDMFVAKYDAYGNLLWVHSLGNNNPEKITALDVDAQGNIYTVGEFTRSMDFNPGPGVATLSVVGYADIFLWSLKPNGDFRFAKAFGDGSLESPNAIDVNASGEIAIAGFFWGTGDMDPSTAHYPVSSKGHSDIFVMRLHPGGNLWWVREFGSSREDQALNVQIGDNDEIYVQGFFKDTVDFNPDTSATAVYNLEQQDGGEGFFLKLDPFGRFVSAFNSPLVPQKMEMRNDRDLFFSGYFTGSQDFDPDTSSVLNLSAVGNETPYFLWKLDSSWTVDWAVMWNKAKMGKNSLSLAQDPSEGAVISASFFGNIDLDPGNGSQVQNSNGLEDIFAAHVDSAGNLVYANTWGGSQTDYPGIAFVNSSGEFYVGGRFHATVDFDPDPAIVDNGTALGLENFMLKLTYCQEVYGYDTIVACNKYTWINSFQYNDNSSGDRYIMRSPGGCDSLVFLTLTMNFIDTTAAKINDTTLQAGQFSANYQWLDCDSALQIIPGATNREFYPSKTGNYAVIVSTTNCLDTSACIFYEVNDFDIPEEASSTLTYNAWPNPSTGRVNLSSPAGLFDTRLMLTDLQGRILKQERIRENDRYEFQLPEASGIYLLHLLRDGERKTIRLIRE